MVRCYLTINSLYLYIKILLFLKFDFYMKSILYFFAHSNDCLVVKVTNLCVDKSCSCQRWCTWKDENKMKPKKNDFLRWLTTEGQMADFSW